MRNATPIVLFAALAALPAQTLVSPSGYGQREGSSANGFPLSQTLRYQQFHPDLKGSARAFKTLAFRRDGLMVAAGQAHSLVLSITMGTCTLANVTTSFAGNYATAGVLVFTPKTVNLPDWSPAPDTVPSAFTVL